MFFKVTALALLGYLAFAPLPPPTAAVPGSRSSAPLPPPPLPPPAPMVVVVPAVASTTQVVDVRRADFEQAMREPRLGRVVPALTDGKPSGFKLYAIRPGSPLAAIGLENGDTLRAINDIPLTSLESALEIYRSLKQPDHFDLDILRKGEQVRIVVLVH